MIDTDALGKISLNRSELLKEPGTGLLQLGVRPEMLAINTINRRNIVDSTEAKIEEISFFGDCIHYKIKLLDSEKSLLVSEMHSYKGPEWKLNDHVFVSWYPDSFVAFV